MSIANTQSPRRRGARRGVARGGRGRRRGRRRRARSRASRRRPGRRARPRSTRAASRWARGGGTRGTPDRRGSPGLGPDELRPSRQSIVKPDRSARQPDRDQRRRASLVRALVEAGVGEPALCQHGLEARRVRALREPEALAASPKRRSCERSPASTWRRRAGERGELRQHRVRRGRGHQRDPCPARAPPGRRAAGCRPRRLEAPHRRSCSGRPRPWRPGRRAAPASATSRSAASTRWRRRKASILSPTPSASS